MRADDEPVRPSVVLNHRKLISHSLSYPAIIELGNTDFIAIVQEFGSLRGFNWRSIAIFSAIFQILFGTVFLPILMVLGTSETGFYCCTWDTIGQRYNVTKVFNPILDFSNPNGRIGSWTISQTMAFDPLRVVGGFNFYGNAFTLLFIYYTRLTILSMLKIDDDFLCSFRAQLLWAHISAFSAYLTSIIPWSTANAEFVHDSAALFYLCPNYAFLFSAAYMENYVHEQLEGQMSPRKWALLGTKFWRRTRLILATISFIFSVVFFITYPLDNRLNLTEWLGVIFCNLANGTFLPQFWAMKSVILVFPRTESFKGQRVANNSVRPINDGSEDTKIDKNLSPIPNHNTLLIEGIGNKEFQTILNQFGRLRGCNWRLVAIASMVIQILFAFIFLPLTMIWATKNVGVCCPEWDPNEMRYNITRVLDPVFILNWEHPWRDGGTWSISQAMEFDPIRIWGEWWWGLLGIALWVMFHMRIIILSMLRLDEHFPCLFRTLWFAGMLASISATLPSLVPYSVSAWVHLGSAWFYVIANYFFTFASTYMENHVINHFNGCNKMTEKKWMLFGTKTWRAWRVNFAVLSLVCELLFTYGRLGTYPNDPRYDLFEWVGVLFLCMSNATYLPQFWRINTAILTF